jgi:hypothetical protein
VTQIDVEKARKARRVAVSIGCRVRYEREKLADVEIQDLSFYGFSARSPVSIAVGSYVSVDLPGIGPVRARIAWMREGSFGAVFPTAVDVRKCVLPGSKG